MLVEVNPKGLVEKQKYGTGSTGVAANTRSGAVDWELLRVLSEWEILGTVLGLHRGDRNDITAVQFGIQADNIYREANKSVGYSSSLIAGSSNPRSRL